MSGRKVQLTVQLEQDLCKLLDEAVHSEGTTRSAWIRKTLVAALPVPNQPAAVLKGNPAMEAAFGLLDTNGGENDYPGVMPLPPVHVPLVEQVSAPAAVAPIPQPQMQPQGHSCASFVPGRTAGFTMSQIGGTCAQKGAGTVPCHFASHIASNCSMYRSTKARIPPMSPIR